MPSLKVNVTGVKELIARFKNVDDKLGKKILKQATRAGGKLALRAMDVRVPVSNQRTEPDLIPKLLKKSLGTKEKTYRASKISVVIVGPRTGMQVNKKTKEKKLSTFGKTRARLAAKHGGTKAQTQNPSYYAHLAGPGRKQRFRDEARDAVQFEVQETMKQTVVSGVESAWDGK